MKGNDIKITQKGQEGGTSSGLAVLMLFLLAAFIMGGIVAVRYLLPSLATEVAASQVETEFSLEMVEYATSTVSNSSVITITLDEFLAHDQEIHRHDEVMNQAALDAVVDVAKSGDVAQGAIAATGDMATAVQGFAMLGVAIAMAVIVFLVINKK